MTYKTLDPQNPPPPLLTDDSQPFIAMTMTQRLPHVIEQVLDDYADQHPQEIRKALQALHTELVNNDLVGPLNSDSSDGWAWFQAWQPYQDNRWREIPWFFAEAFFYRRLLQASGYFGWPLVAAQDSPPDATERALVEDWEKVDPFAIRKQTELENITTWQIVSAALRDSTENSADSLRNLLYYALWGNRADLSYTQVAQASADLTLANERHNLLADATIPVVEAMQDLSEKNIAIICDNAGTELLMDLVLTDFLLRGDWVKQVTLHIKAHPTFVSDTTPADIYHTLMALAAQPDPDLNALGERLQQYGNRLHVKPHDFWNSHHFFWEMPDDIREDLATNQLTFIKGDANYRRLLGDSLAWPVTISLMEAVTYFPTPFACLRTLKSPVIVGLDAYQVEQLDQLDSEWRVNGKRGVIQFRR